MHLYETLAKYQKGANYRKSEDYLFYVQNRHLFNNIEMYKFLLDAKDEFDVIRANIVIHALKSKKHLEDCILYAYKESKMKTEEVSNFMHEQMVGLPYIQETATKIYVPVFSRAVNSFYYSQFGKLLREPYSKLIDNYESSCIDLFEMYNFSLYDSLFTKFITVYRDENVMAVYHFDFHSIYIINNQGRLDAKIALFDKYIKHPKYERIIERIKPVITKYLEDDKEGLYQVLIDNDLISEKLIYKIKHNEFKFRHSLERKAR